METGKKPANVTATHASLPDNFFDLSIAEQLKFVNQLLRGMSPSDRVRSSAGRTNDQQDK